MAESETTVARRNIGSAVLEWFTRREAIATARRDPRALDEQQKTFFARARGALTVADRVAPVEGATVPLEDVGDEVSRVLLAFSMLRDAVSWAVAAETRTSATSLASGFEALDTADLEKAAGGPEPLERARRVLLQEETLTRATRSRDEMLRDLEATRALARGLVDALERRALALSRAHTERWTRIIGAFVTILVLWFGAQAFIAARRPDLVANAHWTASSADLGWNGAGVGLSGPRPGADVFFHTRAEANPWVEFDFGQSRALSRIEVTNRSDCCQERAVPLIVEASTDHRNWREIARRDDAFTTWEKNFSGRPRARWVRLRVPRTTYFHLARVEIH